MRSLLLSKLTGMQKKGVECRLEVLYPVEDVGMDVWDFVRCLGILVDNASPCTSWENGIFVQELTVEGRP